MSNIKFFTEDKCENKLYTFLGGFTGLMLTSLYCFWEISNGIYTVFGPIVVLLVPCLGVTTVNLLRKIWKEEIDRTDGIWNEAQESGKIRKSRFYNPEYEMEITPFGGVITFIFIYLSPYIGGIISLAVKLEEQFPDKNDFNIFIKSVTTVFKSASAREHIIVYWTASTIFIIATVYGLKKLKKKQQQE